MFVQILLGEAENFVVRGGEARARGDCSVFVDEAGVEYLLVDVETGECHNDFTRMWENWPAPA